MIYNAGYCCVLEAMNSISTSHCTDKSMICQTEIGVKEIAWKPILFANRDEQCMNEFRRVSKSRAETASNGVMGVSRDFSFAVYEVRKVGTIMRMNVIK